MDNSDSNAIGGLIVYNDLRSGAVAKVTNTKLRAGRLGTMHYVLGRMLSGELTGGLSPLLCKLACDTELCKTLFHSAADTVVGCEV